MIIFIPDCWSCELKNTSIRLWVSITVLISWVFCSFELETSGKTHERREHKAAQVNPLLKIFADFSGLYSMSSLNEKTRIIAGMKVLQPHWFLPAFVHLPFSCWKVFHQSIVSTLLSVGWALGKSQVQNSITQWSLLEDFPPPLLNHYFPVKT